MRTIRFVSGENRVNLELCNYMTLISGYSGVGKTFLCKQLISDWIIADKISDVYVVNNLIELREYIKCKISSVIIIDNMEQWSSNQLNEACELIRNNFLHGEPVRHYFVIMYRAGINVPFFRHNLYTLEVLENKDYGFDFFLKPFKFTAR